MIVEQFPYLSPEAVALRRRDHVPPWGIHVCEVDAFGKEGPSAPGTFRDHWLQASALRREIESGVAG